MTIQVISYLRRGVYPARSDRWLIEDIFSAGVRLSTDLAVTSTGAALGVSIASGVSYITGSQNPNQGRYRLFNDAALTGTHDAASTNPRWDRWIARAYDSDEAGSGPDIGTIEIVKGTENASAALTNAVGSEVGIGSLAAIYNYYEIARVLVPIGAGPIIPAANIRDMRRVAASPANGSGPVLSARPVLDVGVLNQIRAGRVLGVADFTTLCALPSTPVLLSTPGSLTNLGSGGTLVNKGSVSLAAKDILADTKAYQFTGSTGQALYIVDTGSSDPFRIKTGSWGCWFKTAKRGTTQTLISKYSTGQQSYSLHINTSNAVQININYTGSGSDTGAGGVPDVCDDCWHFVIATYDGNVLRIYTDGVLQGSLASAGVIYGGSAPFNIGSTQADGSTAAAQPHYGRIYQPFATSDVFSEEQIRLLMAASIPHNFALTPSSFSLNVRRKRKGENLVAGDFSANPKHLYAGGSLTDLGSLANNLTANGSPVTAAGADGAPNGAYIFKSASSQYLSATDTGLPSGTSARTLIVWTKSTTFSAGTVLAYGTDAAFIGLVVTGNGISLADVTSNTGIVVLNDGVWHLVVGVIDNAAGDGLKKKLYIDGRLVATDTALASTTLLGATGLRVGRSVNTGTGYLDGSVGPVGITDYAMAEDEILSLYAKGAQALGAVPLLDGADPRQCVQGVDATNVYLLGDVRKKISGRVNSDGTINKSSGGDFRVIKGVTGVYTIYFPPNFFNTAPNITAGIADVANNGAVDVNGLPTVTSVAILTQDLAGSNGDRGFSFIAEGRGPIPSQHALDLVVSS